MHTEKSNGSSIRLLKSQLTERVVQIVIVMYGIDVVNIVELDTIYVVQLQLLDVANKGGTISLKCLLM